MKTKDTRVLDYELAKQVAHLPLKAIGEVFHTTNLSWLSNKLKQMGLREGKVTCSNAAERVQSDTLTLKPKVQSDTLTLKPKVQSDALTLESPVHLNCDKRQLQDISNLIGTRYKLVTVIDTYHKRGFGQFVKCICDCGEEFSRPAGQYKAKLVGSCGCISRKRKEVADELDTRCAMQKWEEDND